MILFELCNEQESHPVYQAFEVSNGIRQYDFLRSIVGASIDMQRPFLSTTVLKALNFHAIGCLHTNAGEFRPCEVIVGTHRPPAHFRVEALVEDMVNQVNRSWDSADPLALAAFILWRLNHIHPFINGNGRTARAACYFFICVRFGGWLPGTTILPELIKRERDRYVTALAAIDASLPKGQLDLEPLRGLLDELLTEQINEPQVQSPDGAVQ
ncbi:MAG: Fic family protein [Paludibacterium sp.]|uniref:Fic family protein n=1 Tax=Paludibacterium sp. TaxID=1917523 RepID=UPI0025F87ACE|nr:Fic family protein [Paludibacterium sp.]MBV8045877.1 Fic family protein [Paludibacterium sp.]